VQERYSGAQKKRLRPVKVIFEDTAGLACRWRKNVKEAALVCWIQTLDHHLGENAPVN
jgi:hypothetical protein